MSGGRVSSREAKTALNSAANMAAVFRDAGELSLERELTFVCEQLRKNEPLLYRLSGYLKDDSLVALLDGRMNATVEQNNEAPIREINQNQANSQSVAPGLEEVGTYRGVPGLFDQPIARGVGLGGEQCLPRVPEDQRGAC